MKLGKLVVLTVILGMLLCGCQTKSTIDDDKIKTTEFLPFYGENRFLIVSEDTDTPIPGAVLQVSNLHIEEARIMDSIRCGQDGRIVIHQINRRDSYLGKGPPRPTFTFSAPHYYTKTYSVEDLASENSYNPYSRDSLPTTTYKYEEEELELPVYEFTIRLVPSD